jgi:hypothetical protein
VALVVGRQRLVLRPDPGLELRVFSGVGRRDLGELGEVPRAAFEVAPGRELLAEVVCRAQDSLRRPRVRPEVGLARPPLERLELSFLGA